MGHRVRVALRLMLVLGFLTAASDGIAEPAPSKSAPSQKKNDDKGKGDAPKLAGKAKTSRPTLDYERFRRVREVDTKMSEKRRAIREQLQNLLKYEKDKKERPALMFRLAENYFDEALSFFYQAQQLDDKLALDNRNEGLRRSIDSQKKTLKQQEDKWRLEAIEIYRQIISQFPHYPELDQVYFYLADSLWYLDRHEESLKVYRQLINAFPASKFVPDAYLAFGEFYWEEAEKDINQLEKALMAYKKVSDYKESPVYPFSLYKQGWCYYNLHEWDKAKEMFESVIHLSDIEAETSGSKVQIRKEALKDFTKTYSHSGGVTQAPEVFRALAPKEAMDMEVDLANLYYSQAQDKKAILMFTYLIKEKGCSADVPLFMGRIVDCASRVGKLDYTVQQVRRLIDRFQFVKKCITNPSEKEREKLREAEDLSESTLRRLASIWYKEAKETKQKETFVAAGELFGLYLRLFPSSKDAYDMRFAYAELMFHRLNKYRQSAVQYSKIVEMDLAFLAKNKQFPPKAQKDSRSSPGSYLCDAAYKSVLAYREINKKKKKDKGKAKDEKDAGDDSFEDKTADKEAGQDDAAAPEGDQEAKPDGKPDGGGKKIPQGKRRFIDAAQVYLDHCPKDQDLCSVKFDIAKTYYDFDNFEEAVRRFDDVVKTCTENDLAEYAANLVLDTFNLKQDFDNLDKYARSYFGNKVLMKNQKLKDELTNLIPQIAFKRIAAMESELKKSKDGQALDSSQIHYKMAQAYIRFNKEFTKHELADEALFNAAVKFEQAERLDLARKAREMLIQDYATSDLVPGTIFNLAENYERMTDFTKAAELYEHYADTYKKMKGLGKAVSYKGAKKKGAKDKDGKDGKDGKEARKGKKGKKGEKDDEETADGPEKKEKEKKVEGNRRAWNNEDAENALLNAGIYREALKQYEEAIKDRVAFTELFPNSEEAPKVQYSLGILYEKMKRFSKASEVFEKYSQDYFRKDTSRAIAAHMMRAEILIKQAKHTEAEKEMKKTLWLFKAHGRKGGKEMAEAAEAAAHAQFLLAEPFYSEYIKYQFRNMNNKQAIAKQLNEKTNRFKRMEKIYTEIAKLKQPEWTIASLYKLGRGYENFAETFYKSPGPAGLNADQQELYKQTLREFGQPYEDKAVAHFKTAVDKGSELGFYSKFTQMSLEKLQQYRPGDYPREDLGFQVSVVADNVSMNPIVTGTWEEVLANPAMLKEPPLPRQRKGDVVTSTLAPEPGKGAEPGGVDAEPVPKEAPASDQGQAAPKDMPADPASDVMKDQEPNDDFQ